jgi:hypothetical protein
MRRDVSAQRRRQKVSTLIAMAEINRSTGAFAQSEVGIWGALFHSRYVPISDQPSYAIHATLFIQYNHRSNQTTEGSGWLPSSAREDADVVGLSLELGKSKSAVKSRKL